MKNDINRETMREILYTDKIASEVKDILMQDSVHNREEEGVRIGSVLSRHRTFKGDSLKVLVNDNELFYDETVDDSSYTKWKFVSAWANSIAKKEKAKFESGLLTPTSTKMKKTDGHHYVYKLDYYVNHEGHQDKITIERDLTELYAKPIHNTLVYGGVTLIFLYIAVISITYITQLIKLREFERVVKEQQIVLETNPYQIRNVGKERNRCLERVSSIMIDYHKKAQEVYIANKNIIQDVSHATASSLSEIKLSVGQIKYYGIEDQERAKPLLEKIDKAANDISSIQTMFMDLAKVENCRTTGFATCCKAQDLINHMIDYLRMNPDMIVIQHKNIKDLSVCIQREHFALVMRTLLENAIKYSTGSKKIVVEILDTPKYKNHLAIKVSNWGSYIPVEERERIFERYFRGEEPRRNNKVGVGLGLHIIKKVMDLYGGTIEVESDSSGEQKTSFIVAFPVDIPNDGNL